MQTAEVPRICRAKKTRGNPDERPLARPTHSMVSSS
jgi:hypothetical protein